MYADVYLTFVINSWLLLPETDIIDVYYNSINTCKLPKIDANVYQYTLIAHEKMRGVPIHDRRTSYISGSLMLTISPFTPLLIMTSPPLDHMPIPASLYAIAGSKLDKSGLLQWQAREMRKGDLAKVVAIWNSWEQEVPTGEFVEKTSEDASGDPDIIEDHKTCFLSTDSNTSDSKCMAEVRWKLEGDGVEILSIVV
ncbi:hypothetical protein EDB92DRAFT_1815065 [Lactarius akahatsu]|uniref:Uncharacterized protein n=1 Tax=Lactarius akahatsu TaxID=416441 RepID=A0AAD4LJU8_9AGAM|nr:hypothetical protein EDB92DRAFT_1815065 [Lactarius akahatsu]